MAQCCQALPYPFFPLEPRLLPSWSTTVPPTVPPVHDHSESKGVSAGSFCFSHKLPQRPGWRERWAISFGTGGGENTGRKEINKSASLSLSSAPPATTSLICPRCALSYTDGPTAPISRFSGGVSAPVAHHCPPSPAVVLTWPCAPHLTARLGWGEKEACGDPGLRRPHLHLKRPQAPASPPWALLFQAGTRRWTSTLALE